MTKTLLDAQMTVELPAREMLGWNFNAIFANQQAANQSTQLNLVGLFQLNAAEQTNANTIAVVND